MKSYKERKRYIVCRESEEWDSPLYALDKLLKFEKFDPDYGRESYLTFKYKRLAQEVVDRLMRKKQKPGKNYFVDEIWV